jgi:hypothetical protein
MTLLAAIILTKNESAHIVECIASLRALAAKVIVFDSLSDDGTQRLAQEAGARVVERPFDHYAAQRQAALAVADTDWVLFVDADERVTPSLAEEIAETLRAPRYNGYWIARRNFIVGREVCGGGFFPDYQLRLLRRTIARYLPERQVHELVDVGGAEGYLRQPLIHLNYRDWGQFHAKQRRYAAYEAAILQQRGIRPRPHNFILQPLREFRRRFVTLQGWRDGLHGFRLACLLAWYYGFLPYWLLARRPATFAT